MEINEAIIVPVILALVEILKKAGVPGKYAPLVSLVLGIGGMFLFSGFSLESGIKGLVFGLSASGLYSGTKAVVKKPEPPTPAG